MGSVGIFGNMLFKEGHISETELRILKWKLDIINRNIEKKYYFEGIFYLDCSPGIATLRMMNRSREAEMGEWEDKIQYQRLLRLYHEKWIASEAPTHIVTIETNGKSPKKIADEIMNMI